jgi:YggT family protein
MLTQIGLFLLQTACSLYAALLLMRAWAFATQAPMRQPVGEAIMALTDKLVLPMRRALPKTQRIDWACLLLALLVAVIDALGTALLMAGASAGTAQLVGLAWLAPLLLLRWAIYLLIAVLIVQAVLSFVQPHSPISSFTNHLTGPLLDPIRRVLPQPGGLDLSPLVVIVVAQVLLIVLA